MRLPVVVSGCTAVTALLLLADRYGLSGGRQTVSVTDKKISVQPWRGRRSESS
ncbi:MAG TPA: hypothetical protein VGO37_11245 [Steroidobacteraceae bacterium]|jgi:hypothetical protein|nr:hypothetical protein [Steroidobacteraceae bacterium]